MSTPPQPPKPSASGTWTSAAKPQGIGRWLVVSPSTRGRKKARKKERASKIDALTLLPPPPPSTADVDPTAPQPQTQSPLPQQSPPQTSVATEATEKMPERESVSVHPLQQTEATTGATATKEEPTAVSSCVLPGGQEEDIAPEEDGSVAAEVTPLPWMTATSTETTQEREQLEPTQATAPPTSPLPQATSASTTACPSPKPPRSRSRSYAPSAPLNQHQTPRKRLVVAVQHGPAARQHKVAETIAAAGTNAVQDTGKGRLSSKISHLMAKFEGSPQQKTASLSPPQAATRSVSPRLRTAAVTTSQQQQQQIGRPAADGTRTVVRMGRKRSKSIGRCEGIVVTFDLRQRSEYGFPLRCVIREDNATFVVHCTRQTTVSEAISLLPHSTSIIRLETDHGTPLDPRYPVCDCPAVLSCLASDMVPTVRVILRKQLSRDKDDRKSRQSVRQSAAISPVPQDGYTLHVVVEAGGQVLNVHCPWPTTFREISTEVVPRLLRGDRDTSSAIDMSVVKVGPPDAIAAVVASNMDSPFYEICRKGRTLPHALVREEIAVPEGLQSTFCQEHNSECFVVTTASGNTRHIPAAVYGRVDAEIDLLLESLRTGASRGDSSEGRHFNAVAQRLRHAVSKRSEARLPFSISSAPRMPAPGEPFMATVTLPLRQVTKTFPITNKVTADEFFMDIFCKYYAKAIPGVTASKYILKAKGLNSFVFGQIPVLSFSCIQQAISKKTRPELVITERPPDIADPSAEERFDSPELLCVPDEVARFDHDEIAIARVPWGKRMVVSSWDLTQNFRVFVSDVVGLVVSSSAAEFAPSCCFALVAGLYHGGELLCPEVASDPASVSSCPRWGQWLEFALPMFCVPRAARVCFTVISRPTRGLTVSSSRPQPDDSKKGDTAVAWTSTMVFDFRGELASGHVKLSMWPNARPDPVALCQTNPAHDAPRLNVQFEVFHLPVVFPTHGSFASGRISQYPSAENEFGMYFGQLIEKDSLYPLTALDRRLLWRKREIVVKNPKLLPKELLSVDYTNPSDVLEGHRLLGLVEMAPVDAIELLESKYADSAVRGYAVRCMRNMSKADLLDCLLQMVQSLKHEAYHTSELALFLLDRALRDQTIGHLLYWSLKSGMADADSRERYGLLVEAFLRGCGDSRNALLMQEAFVRNLSAISRKLKSLKESERMEYLQSSLKGTAVPPRFPLPLNPEFLSSRLVVERCKYMDSAKMPLYLVLENAESDCEPAHVIFKEGDDLRQDGLTLQMIRIMDKLWKSEGLDLEMSPYRTICVGPTTGFIEVVLNAKTTAEIHKGAGGASAAFRQDPLANWLRAHNPQDAMYRKCVRRFVLSCAGYSVATYVLGISDRHNDNIMLTTSGRLFHIDFGHFLGHKKTFIGINREPAPFVFTPDFAFVMGGKGAPDFEEFVNIACQAYSILRKNSSTFINLFALMLSTGIPELESLDDIAYLREAFALDMDPASACSRFKELIFLSLATWTTRLNNAIHIAMRLFFFPPPQLSFGSLTQLSTD